MISVSQSACTVSPLSSFCFIHCYKVIQMKVENVLTVRNALDYVFMESNFTSSVKNYELAQDLILYSVLLFTDLLCGVFFPTKECWV